MRIYVRMMAFWIFALGIGITSKAETVGYYIGIDGQTTIPSGTYAGLPNPHANDLIFLFAHPSTAVPSSSHYHSKGRFIYTGPNLGASTAIMDVNHPLPEDNTFLPLTPGTGLYNGIRRQKIDPTNEYSDLRIRTTSDLSTYAAGTPELFMFNSSGGRYTGGLGDTQVSMKLISISPGLNIGTESSLSAGFSGPGSSIVLGTGNGFSFEPVFWADNSVADFTNLSARFQLIAGGTNSLGIGDSGTFTYNVQAVPEPGTYALLGIIAVGFVGWQYSQRRKNKLAIS